MWFRGHDPLIWHTEKKAGGSMIISIVKGNDHSRPIFVTPSEKVKDLELET